MASVTVNASQVRPLNGASVRRLLAGASLSVGQAVYVHSDGLLRPASATSQQAAQARGVVVGVGTAGKTSAALGEAVDVVTHGAVALGTGDLPEGAALFISATAGAFDPVPPALSGQFVFVLGWAESPEVLYVAPQVAVPTANA